MRTSDVMYCVFSNPKLYKVIYCATSYANAYNIYKNECVRPVKKFHSMYLLISPDNQTVYSMELVDISGAKVNNI